MFAVAHQDGRRTIIAAALLGAAVLAWWAAQPATPSSPVARRAPATRTTCTHAGAVPVTSTVTGEILAALCPACDQQLPAEFPGCLQRLRRNRLVPGSRGDSLARQRRDDRGSAEGGASAHTQIEYWPGGMF